MRTTVLSIFLLCGSLSGAVSHAAAQTASPCTGATLHEHDILAQLAQFREKSDQEKRSSKDEYCNLQKVRRASLNDLRSKGGCGLYKADRLEGFIASNQKVLDRDCK